MQLEDVFLQAGRAHPRAMLQRLRAKLGLVFQFHHLFEHMSVLKNVWLAPVHARGHPRREAENRARELLAAVGVEHRAAALPRELSGGEAQRVAIARALAVDPPMLLLDEPTAALDADRRDDLGELLRSLTRQGRTLLIATHDQEFARKCASRVLHIRDGRVLERVENC
jgi:ABC-type polar amino acid transport system ATPase subunit